MNRCTGSLCLRDGRDAGTVTLFGRVDGTEMIQFLSLFGGCKVFTMMYCMVSEEAC
jgi:hypothetical protein